MGLPALGGPVLRLSSNPALPAWPWALVEVWLKARVDVIDCPGSPGRREPEEGSCRPSGHPKREPLQSGRTFSHTVTFSSDAFMLALWHAGETDASSYAVEAMCVSWVCQTDRRLTYVLHQHSEPPTFVARIEARVRNGMEDREA